MAELVQENEQQKKSVERLERENAKLQDQMRKQNQKLSRLTFKIDQMKRKISLKDLELLNEDQFNDKQSNSPGVGSAEEDRVFLNQELNRNLDFRIQQLKFEYSHLLNEISEQGSAVFTNLILKNQNQKQQTEYISLVTTQFLSFKEVGDNLTVILRNFIEMSKIDDLEKLITFVQEDFKQIFLSESCNLWIIDKFRNVYFTNKTGNLNNKQMKAQLGKGILGEVERTQQMINLKDQFDNILYYRTSDEPGDQKVFRVDSCLCFPIYKQDQLCGILEISNARNKNFGFDEEFYGSILAKFLCTLLQRLVFIRSIKVELKYQSYFHDSFCDLVQSRNMRELQPKLKEWVSKIFGSDIFSFIHVTEGKLVKIENNKQTTYELNQGLAGQCALTQKQFVNAYADSRADYFLATKNSAVVVSSSSYIWRTMKKFPFVGS